MPHIRTQRHVHHSAAQMFALVADVEKYPEFVPHCAGLKILSRSDEGGQPVIDAIMYIHYKMFSEHFTSRVTLDEANGRIQVQFLSGPMKSLSNEWKFISTGAQSCTVDFTLAYEFKNPLLGAAMNATFKIVFGKFAESFEKRADSLYTK